MCWTAVFVSPDNRNALCKLKINLWFSRQLHSRCIEAPSKWCKLPLCISVCVNRHITHFMPYWQPEQRKHNANTHTQLHQHNNRAANTYLQYNSGFSWKHICVCRIFIEFMIWSRDHIHFGLLHFYWSFLNGRINIYRCRCGRDCRYDIIDIDTHSSRRHDNSAQSCGLSCVRITVIPVQTSIASDTN